MRIKSSYVVAIGLVALAAALAYSAFASYLDPYLTVTQVRADANRYLNTQVQVLGDVGEGSVEMKIATLLFDLVDNESAINVVYEGSLPNNFKEGQQVVVVGMLRSSNSIEAARVLTKCPSKYEGEESSILASPVFLAALVLGLAAAGYIAVSTIAKTKKV